MDHISSGDVRVLFTVKITHISVNTEFVSEIFVTTRRDVNSLSIVIFVTLSYLPTTRYQIMKFKMNLVCVATTLQGKPIINKRTTVYVLKLNFFIL